MTDLKTFPGNLGATEVKIGKTPHHKETPEQQAKIKNGDGLAVFVMEETPPPDGQGNNNSNNQAKAQDDDPWALPELKDDSVPWSDLTTRGKFTRTLIGVVKAGALLLLLYLFICSLNFLSSALRLMAGKQASGVMSRVELLKNPVVGLMLGVIATVLVQSSSTSTSIVITMVGAGLLEVKYSIPIIMGANIGTSVTNTFVSFTQAGDRNNFRRAFAAATVHDMFNWLTVIILLPIEVGTGYLEQLSANLVSSSSWEQNKGLNKAFLTVITKPFTSIIIQLDKEVLDGIAVNKTAYENATLMKHCCKLEGDACGSCGYLMEYFNLGDLGTGILMLVLSLTLLCTCLYLIVKVLKSVLKGQIAVIIKKLVNADPRFPLNHLVGYAAMLIGCCMTILVQSSSIFTSALTPLAGIGVITIDRMYPLTLGSNVGTTTTGILAALAADPKRLKYTLQIAFCHLFFNMSGILLFYPIPFMRFPVPLAKMLGNITAEYRWFSVFYLLLMFILLPFFVFALSIAGRVTFMVIGVPTLILAILVILVNVLQRKRPSMLPRVMRNWNYLPEWMRSLDPADRVLSKMCSSCKCCKRCAEPESPSHRTLSKIKSNESKENILKIHDSSFFDHVDPKAYDNQSFSWKPKADADFSTRL